MTIEERLKELERNIESVARYNKMLVGKLNAMHTLANSQLNMQDFYTMMAESQNKAIGGAQTPHAETWLNNAAELAKETETKKESLGSFQEGYRYVIPQPPRPDGEKKIKIGCSAVKKKDSKFEAGKVYDATLKNGKITMRLDGMPPITFSEKSLDNRVRTLYIVK